jgi:hypothetical protein
MDTRRGGRLPAFPFRRLFWTCWFVYAVHWTPFMIREQFPAVSLATAGTLNVARFVGWTPDIFMRPDGRAFINNNPGASLLAAVPLLAARPALDALEQWNDRAPSSSARRELPEFAESSAVQGRREWYFMAVAFITVVFVMAPTSSFAVTIAGSAMSAAGLPVRLAVAVSVLLGFATPIFVRTGYLNHNLLVGHAGLLGFLLLWNRGRSNLAPFHAAAAGALGGFAILCDYSGVLVLPMLVAYAWLRLGDSGSSVSGRLRLAAAFALGAVPPLLALAAYQWWAFGSSTLPSQHYMTAIAETNRGYRGMDWPSLDIAMMNFFDPRFGLFAVCPLLALGLAAPLVPRAGFRIPKREMWLFLIYFFVFTVFCAANQYSRLQWTTGIRYLVPTIPGLLVLSAQVLYTLPPILRRLVLAVSVVLAWIPAVTHRPLTAAFLNPGEFQLSWARRMNEYGVLQHPAAATAVSLALMASIIFVFWRPDIADALRQAASTRSARGEAIRGA